MKKITLSKSRQYELPKSGDVFNLAGQVGIDPMRVIREQFDDATRRAAARDYELKMQRVFAGCPGFVGGDMPIGDDSTGHVIIEPSRALEARDWLKRRFHISPNLELSDLGIALDVVPRSRKAPSPSRAGRCRFDKPIQYELALV